MTDIWPWLGERATMRTLAITDQVALHHMALGFRRIPLAVQDRLDVVLQHRANLIEAGMSEAAAARWFTSPQELEGSPTPRKPSDLVRRGQYKLVKAMVFTEIKERSASAA
jgi:hypothetical protein